MYYNYLNNVKMVSSKPIYHCDTSPLVGYFDLKRCKNINAPWKAKILIFSDLYLDNFSKSAVWLQIYLDSPPLVWIVIWNFCLGKTKFRWKHVDRPCRNAKTQKWKSYHTGIFFPNGCPGLCRHRPRHPLGKKILVWYDFHFHVLAFLQGLSTCFHLNLALHKQKIQITIKTRGVASLIR